jgi:threonine/homoserine/homoserine lactone efflux protein
VLGQLLAFLGVALLVIVVPGPDTALTVRNALTGGRRSGVATAAGVATGQAVWTIATGVGIAELIQASEPAFLALKVTGAAYLIALGIQSLWTAVCPSVAGLWTTQRAPNPGRLRSPTKGPDSGGSRCGVPGVGSGAPGGGRLARDESGRRAGGSERRAGRSGARARAGLRPRRAFRQGVVSNLANPKMPAFFLSLLPQFVGPGRGGAGSC